MSWWQSFLAPWRDPVVRQAVTVDIPVTLAAMEARMGAREDAAYAKLGDTINTIKDGWAAKDAEIRVLREQLANADADAQARVDAALEADSDVDAGKVEAADAALAELVAVAPEPEPGDGEPANS